MANKRYKTLAVICGLLWVLVLTGRAQTGNDPTLDNVNGLWRYEFANADGIEVGKSIEVVNGRARLKEAALEGYLVTVVIAPASVSSLTSLDWQGAQDAGANITVELLDQANTAYQPSGSGAGGKLSLAHIRPLVTPSRSKALSYKIRVNFSRQAAGDDVSLDALVFRWTPRLHFAAFDQVANSGWPSWKGDTARPSGGNVELPPYSVVSWVDDFDVDFGGNLALDGQGFLYSKTFGQIFNRPPIYGKITKHNPVSGVRLWQNEWSGMAGSSNNLLITQAGKTYISDIFHDIWVAFDNETGRLAGSRNFVGGHGNQDTALTNGNIISTTRVHSDDLSFRFVSSGLDLAPLCESPSYAIENAQLFTSGFAQTRSDKVALGVAAFPAANIFTGKVMLFDPSTCALLWSKDTGNALEVRSDEDNNIYALSQDNSGFLVSAWSSGGQNLWQTRLPGGIVINGFNILSPANAPEVYVSYKEAANDTSAVHILDIANGRTVRVWSTACAGDCQLYNDRAKNFIATQFNQTTRIGYLSVSPDGAASPVWSYGQPLAIWLKPALSDSGWLYAHLNNIRTNQDKLVAFAPLANQVFTNKSGPNQAVEVVSTLPPVNPLTGQSNKITVELPAFGETAALSSNGVRQANGLYRWLATFPIPRQTASLLRVQMYLSHSQMVTNTPIPASFAAQESQNTGIISTHFVRAGNF